MSSLTPSQRVLAMSTFTFTAAVFICCIILKKNDEHWFTDAAFAAFFVGTGFGITGSAFADLKTQYRGLAIMASVLLVISTGIPLIWLLPNSGINFHSTVALTSCGLSIIGGFANILRKEK